MYNPNLFQRQRYKHQQYNDMDPRFQLRVYEDSSHPNKHSGPLDYPGSMNDYQETLMKRNIAVRPQAIEPRDTLAMNRSRARELIKTQVHNENRRSRSQKPEIEQSPVPKYYGYVDFQPSQAEQNERAWNFDVRTAKYAKRGPDNSTNFTTDHFTNYFRNIIQTDAVRHGYRDMIKQDVRIIDVPVKIRQRALNEDRSNCYFRLKNREYAKDLEAINDKNNPEYSYGGHNREYGPRVIGTSENEYSQDKVFNYRPKDIVKRVKNSVQKVADIDIDISGFQDKYAFQNAHPARFDRSKVDKVGFMHGHNIDLPEQVGLSEMPKDKRQKYITARNTDKRGNQINNFDVSLMDVQDNKNSSIDHEYARHTSERLNPVFGFGIDDPLQDNFSKVKDAPRYFGANYNSISDGVIQMQDNQYNNNTNNRNYDYKPSIVHNRLQQFNADLADSQVAAGPRSQFRANGQSYKQQLSSDYSVSEVGVNSRKTKQASADPRTYLNIDSEYLQDIKNKKSMEKINTQRNKKLGVNAKILGHDRAPKQMFRNGLSVYSVDPVVGDDVSTSEFKRLS